MAAEIRGWSYGPAQRDTDGHRAYKVVLRVATAQADGPVVAMLAADAYLPMGGYYDPPSAAAAETDIYAYRRQETTVRPAGGLDNTAVNQWLVELTYSTKNDTKSCKESQPGNPLLEPMKVSGGFTKYTEEATFDRFGNYIVSSSHELMRGAQTEFDANRPSVKVEQNVAALQLPLLAALVDCVNDATLWGLPARCVKLSNAEWEVKYYGSCFSYYTRKLEFDIRYDGFDRDLLDEGSKVLHGRWHPTLDQWQLIDIAGSPPNPANPMHFDRYKDRNNENTRVLLNGAGIPISTDPSGTATSTQSLATRFPGRIRVEKYPSANLLLLGIPVSV